MRGRMINVLCFWEIDERDIDSGACAAVDTYTCTTISRERKGFCGDGGGGMQHTYMRHLNTFDIYMDNPHDDEAFVFI